MKRLLSLKLTVYPIVLVSVSVSPGVTCEHFPKFKLQNVQVKRSELCKIPTDPSDLGFSGAGQFLVL